MPKNNNSDNYSPRSIGQFSFDYCKDKDTVFQNYCRYTFTRTQSMFVYDGLPDTIPQAYLEQYLQQNGSCCIAKVNGELYALLGSAGGEPDPYFQPTIYTVANPALNLSETYKIGEDCVYARNDYSAIGLIPLVCRYAGLMTENLLTVRLSDINMRMMNLLSAPDDNTLASAKQYLKDLELGKLGVVGESPFFEGLKLQSNSLGSGDYMIQFIELQQYLKGSLYNELGINANFNMKREALSSQELALNDDALMPLIDNMLKERRKMCDDVNKMFGTNITVDYGSAWHSNSVEKALIADTELDGNSSENAELAGDEQALNNVGEPIDPTDVSRLNDEPEGDADGGADSLDDTELDYTEPDKNEPEPDDKELEPDDKEPGAGDEESGSGDEDSDDNDPDDGDDDKEKKKKEDE